MKKFGMTSWLFVFLAIALFLYSYTQVDLSLTLSRASMYQAIEKNFQFIGYFDRPLSTYIYTGILIVMFMLYIRLLILAQKDKIQRKEFWILTIFITIILTFSYNAFSYDLFNNIFDAKVLTHYHLNPYQYNALDFPHDPMLSFMHWTQRAYPYGPFWLLFSVPVSFIGSNVFLLTFFLFKILAGFSYLGTVYFLEKIALRMDKKNVLLKTMLFALNPLVIIEGLISAHNDMTMFFFAMFAFYLLIQKKNIRSGILLLISCGIKFATVSLIPVFGIVYILRFLNKKINWEYVFFWSVLFMILSLIAASLRTTFQPWYLLYVLPFAAVIGNRFFIVPSVVMSMFALSEYIPFLYTGNWNPPIPAILNILTLSGIVCSAAIIILLILEKRIRKMVQ